MGFVRSSSPHRRIWPVLLLFAAATASSADPANTATDRILVNAQEMQQLQQRRPTLRQEVDQLLDLTRDKTSTQALTTLQSWATDTTRPALERDALVYGYTMSLRQLRANQVAPAVMQWLENYPVQRWQPHEESASYRLPVLNVAAALQGTRNEWSYQAGADAVLSSGAQHQNATHNDWVLQQYSRGDAAYRRGFEQNLQRLSRDQLELLQRAVSSYPSMNRTPMAGYLAHQMDRLNTQPTPSAFEQWLSQAPASSAVPVLREISAEMAAAQREPVLFAAAHHTDDAVFAVAVAEFARLSQHSSPALPAETQRRWLELIRGWLGHPQRGAAAAQAAVTLADDTTLAQWQSQATENDNSLFNQRLALIQRLRDANAKNQTSATAVKTTGEAQS